ncbi:Helix-turn-helix domain protein [compost metagenome]
MHESQQLPIQRRTIDVKTAAKIIGVSTTSVYADVRQGLIPHIRVRNRILFHVDVLEEWLRSGGVTA